MIDASPSKVWELLTAPALMKGWMAETAIKIDTSWEIGSAIIISGDSDEMHFENTGTVLQFKTERVLSYNHLSSLSNLPDQVENRSIIMFDLMGTGNQTALTLTLNNFPTLSIYKHFEFYWSVTIEIFKKMAER